MAANLSPTNAENATLRDSPTIGLNPMFKSVSDSLKVMDNPTLAIQEFLILPTADEGVSFGEDTIVIVNSWATIAGPSTSWSGV